MGAGGKANHNTKIIVARSLDPKYYPNSKMDAAIHAEFLFRKDGMIRTVMRSEIETTVIAETKNFHMITHGSGTAKLDIE